MTVRRITQFSLLLPLACQWGRIGLVVLGSVRGRAGLAPFLKRGAGRHAETLRCGALAVLSLVLLWPAVAMASVQALFNVDVVEQAPFPSDRFTVPNPDNITELQVNLPLPDCTARPSDCSNVRVINTLDGFNLDPRLSIPFSGPIDVNSVSSDTIFLVELGRVGRPFENHDRKERIVGINQVVWEPATNTLHAKSDQLLEQDTAYALGVTDGVHDSIGQPVQPAAAFTALPTADSDFNTSQPYLAKLWDAVADLWDEHMVVASVFTTQSVTALLEKIRWQLDATTSAIKHKKRELHSESGTTPAPADFLLGPGGTRTVFALSAITGLTFTAQTGTAPSFTTISHTPFLASLNVLPGVVGQLAFGKYSSPDYEVHPGEFLPPIGTRTGVPVVQGRNDLYFNLILPAGPTPPGGWPVAIFGHGNTASKHYVYVVAAQLAAHGIATIAINAVGHGFGPLGTLTVNKTDGTSVTFPAGGRGIDQNANGAIDANEGLVSTRPLLSWTDGLRQTVVDLMQLVRVIRVGMDVDGDGTADLDPSRIYYFGQSLGGVYGTMLLAVDEYVLVGVPNVAGGPLIDLLRLSPFGRPALRASLAARVPSLLNIGGGTDFDENLPLRDQPLLINTVPGADELQQVFDRSEWVTQPGNAVAYAPYIRKEPLADVPAKSTIFQFAKGDEQAPNPTNTALLRAGDLADVATFYRNDLAVAADPLVLKTPHGFLRRIPPFSSEPLENAIALDAQEQVATFFESDGETIINPDARFFEVPLVPPLPETCNFLFPLPPGFFPNCP